MVLNVPQKGVGAARRRHRELHYSAKSHGENPVQFDSLDLKVADVLARG
ncbi:hypothetical protein [Nostoc sp. UHCC 0251]|nr:hypothetical protein [Nostoc sp. UHCC 0251]MEA5627543.1 hypothetical protein [Nostoc sp. UHCC 0251]